VVEGPDANLEVESRDGELNVGSSKGNEMVLSDGAVSRHHCLFKSTDAGIVLTDLDSKNGTQLEGARIISGYVKPGHRIVVGTSALTVHELDSDTSAMLSKETRFGSVLGKSTQMRRLFAVLPRIAQSDATVLIQGETGTGKGVLAESIHEASPRADKPLVVVDCGALPPSLLESELFGHEKGAFTGAVTAKVGMLEAANGGTVFFDEIGELPLELQPKLLRFLENRTVRRVGSNKNKEVDVRVIAATNRDLRKAVNAERFRSDLLYRLNTVKLTVPPLRERPEDIPLLVEHFFEQFAPTSPAFTASELSSLLQLGSWPGNVRELRSTVERGLLFGDLGGNPGDTVASGDAPTSYREAKAGAINSWERQYLSNLLSQNDNNLSRAARAAQMDRTYLRQRLRALGLRD
jgi:transcriptional regulator with GAF, ATPase, and Fis domain